MVGAGPAGSACALALAQDDVDGVALLDAGARPGRPPIGESIPPDTRLLLDRLGVVDEFLREGHEPCLGSSSAWGSDQLGFNDFVLNPHGPGWHLDRARFDDLLRRRAVDAGAVLVEGARLEGVTVDGPWHRLHLAGGRTTRARFVVDATGRASAFARAVGARQVPLDRLTVVYGWFDTREAAGVRSRLTLLEAERRGWWYAAELPGDRLAVALATDADLARADGLTHEAAWLAAAHGPPHLASRLEGCRLVAGPTPVVARSFLLDPGSGPGWVAIGDAAAAFDPIAAQGIHKALDDGIAAAEAIAAARGRDAEVTAGPARRIRAGFDEYLANRNHFYGLERRWPDAPFWQRRQARVDLPATG
ncbi:MAG TPA: tryptophan 7-halogenase [Iamia sp.]|nr:tryptophan 7-halogenase [Iamia sp.]